MRDARTLGLSLSIIVCSQRNYTPLMLAADGGHTDILGLPMLQILAFLRGHGLTITPPGTAVPE